MNISNKTMVMKYLRPYVWILLFLFIFIVANTIINLVNPQMISKFIDTAISNGSTNDLIYIALLFLGLSFVGQAINVLDTYISQSVAWKTTNKLREDLMAHCLNLGPSFHQSKTPGEMIERVDGDVSFLSGFLSSLFVSLLSNFFLLAGIIISLFSIHILVGASFLVFTVFMFVFIKKLNKYSVPFWIKNREASGSLFGFIEERLYGTEAIKHNRAIGPMINALEKRMTAKLVTERKAFMASTMTWSSTVSLFAISSSIALGWGVYLYSKGSISIGAVFLVYTYAQMIRTPIEQLSNQFQDIQKASASIKRVSDILEISETESIKEGNRELESGQPLSIEFKNVSFGYDQEQVILKDVSFALPAGKTLSIVGRTGSGKSTIARLLYRFYEYNQGEIYLNGCSIREFNKTSIRDNLSLVTQEIQIFHGTLRDNITFFNSEISDGRIEETFRVLNIWEWYVQFPQGLDTVILGSGMHLSDGGSQIIALVRVVLKDPKVVIMDEATASMDPYTEATIIKALDTISKDRTVIIIAHRVQTLNNADSILVLEDGMVAEYGKKESVLSNESSRFNTLFGQSKGELVG